MNTKVARNGLEARSAELMAAFEERLAATYPANDPRWSDIVEAAEAAVAEADRQVREACLAAGVPEEFRPALTLGWRSRGSNGAAERRAELRRLATARLAAQSKAAGYELDRQEARVCTEILSDGLRSEAARGILASIPSAAQLMAPLDLVEIEAEVVTRGRRS